MELRKDGAKGWLEGANEIQIRYRLKKKLAYEFFEDAEEEYNLADGAASMLLINIYNRLEEKFYLHPMNKNKKFLYSQSMLSTEVLNTMSDNVLERARVALSNLKRKRDRYQSLCNQSLILEERMDVVLDLLDQNEDTELIGDMCDHMRGQRVKALTEELENKIATFTGQLQDLKVQTKEISDDVNLHGAINTATQSKEHIDDYVAEFLRNRGILVEQEVYQIENETVPLLVEN